MIEKKLISSILNNNILYDSFKPLKIKIADNECRYILTLIELIKKTHGKWSNDLITDYITEKKDFDLYKYFEILDLCKHEDNFKVYIDKLLKRDLEVDILNYISSLKRTEKNYIEIKIEIENIISSKKNIEEIEIRDIKEICRETVEKMKKDYLPLKLFSAIDFLDDNQRGYDPTDYVIIASGESVGKTSFIIDCIVKQLRNEMKIAFFECEMSIEKIFQLTVSNISGVPSHNIEHNKLTDPERVEVVRGLEKIYDSNLYLFDDVTNWEIVKKRIMILKKEKNIDVVYIDYLHYLRVDGLKNEYERLEYISKDIKALTRQLKIPIICLATLNKEGKFAEEPELWHIKGNGDIGYDADIAIFLKTLNKAVYGDDDKRLIGFYVRKNRNGKQGVFNQIFDTTKRKFSKTDMQYEKRGKKNDNK
jgi:replicative DNA helicase